MKFETKMSLKDTVNNIMIMTEWDFVEICMICVKLVFLKPYIHERKVVKSLIIMGLC